MENPNYDVVISGMGSAGLAAAIEAVRAQKRVLIITDRDDSFVRFQRVLLLPSSCQYLVRIWFMSLPEHTSPKQYNLNNDETWKQSTSEQFLRAKKYLNSLTDEEMTKVVPNQDDRKLLKAICKHVYTTSSLKDIERFMMRRLRELEAKNGKLDIQYHSQLTDVNLKNGTARYTNSETEKLIAFNHLIGADGSNRHALSLVSKNELTTPISLKLQDIGFSKDHAIAYIVISRADDNDLEIPKKDFLTRVDKAHNYAAVFFDRASHEKSDRKKIKCSIALEVPHEILSIADLEERKIKMMQHISETVKAFFKENNIDNGKLTIEVVKSSVKHGIKKDKLKFSFFQSSCMQADKPAITEGDKQSQHNFFLIGDAYKNPIYPFGNGLNDALQHASELGRVIRGEQSLKNFSNNMDFITSRHSGVLTLILEDMGKEGVIEGLEEIIEKADQRALREQAAQTQSPQVR